MGLDQCVSIEDLRRRAKRRLPGPVFGYLESGAEDEITRRGNRAAFEAYSLVPRVLRDVSKIDMGTTILGSEVKLPILVAPTGFTRLFHPAGELAVAKAATKARVWYSLSTYASETMEAVAEVAPGPKLFQLYCQRDRDLQDSIVDRAESAGYDALCVTVDTGALGNREDVVRSGLMRPPVPPLRTIVRLLRNPIWLTHFLLDCRPELAIFGAGRAAVHEYSPDPAFDWTALRKLRDRWPRRLVLKGILSAEDARRAVQAGVDGVIVSNHGGRQLDRAPATLEVLPEVVAAVGDDCEVLVDGGIRRGTDIVTALALGARGCLAGQALVYGLGAGGQAGVSRALRILKDELRRTMTLLGASRIADLDESLLRRRP